MPETGSPIAVTLLGIFWAFGACAAALAGGTLIWRGTALDQLWTLNEPAYKVLAPVGTIVGPLFLLLSGTLLLTTIGWFRRWMWGWRMAVGVVSIQIAGDCVNLVRGDYVRGGTGVVVAGALLLFLLRHQVREQFS